MLGHSNQIVKELKKLIGELHPAFKRDLGLICESHHLDDLDNFSKYKTNYSYGSSKDEQVNLQYIAIILRTTDLLHITSSRTPSVEFNLINPSDPISQNEWYKQMAVSAVKAKPKRNSEGEIDHSLVKDTIEVTAYFDKPEKADSFFGLIAYLGYVKMQLQKSFQWIQLANKIQGSRYEFNWRNIDDSLIETRGFEKKLFEFILDQTKILKLLVGHTLYNDITVVYREIIQNSIDAIRLQKMIKGEDHSYLGKVQISFNKENKELIIRDNGTGMTQEIIEKHLLNIGSSRYQDEIFVKRFPNFSPISRFGIGILTLFLISDDIQIITCSEDEDFAKLLRLKKVEGKYLLQHLKKYELNNFISVHGTEIKIKVREGINLSQIENDIKKWILFPSCEVEYIVGEQVKKIGYSSPKEALEVFFKGRDYSYGDRIEIREEVRNGLTLAYAIVEDSFTGSSSLMEASEETTYAIRNHPIGLCIEGIRVQDTTPGYKGLKFFATANFSGSNGPKTNVARSLIEDNNEKQMLLKTIYQIYADFIKSKIAELFL